MWISKKNFNKITERMAELERYNNSHINDNKRLTARNAELHDETIELNKRILEVTNLLNERLMKTEELEQQLHNFNLSDKNEVTMRIDDDLISITPIVRWKEGTTESLIQLGAITDANASEMTTQIALMTIAYEALETIIEGLTAPTGEQ